MTFARVLSLSIALTAALPAALADTIALPAAADNTLYEDIFGTYSNGSGDYLFAGRTAAGDIRRGLMRFDVSAIPSSATINSVSLRLHMSRTVVGGQTIGLHRTLESWGEGASNAEAQEGGGIDAEPGDATWVHRFYSTTNWSTPGGVFSAVASATRSVSGVGFYTWASSPGLVADVQGWVSGSVGNHGWVIRGNEANSFTAKRFDTRENFDVTRRPVLTVDFTRIPEPTAGLLLLALAAFGRRRRSAPCRARAARADAVTAVCSSVRPPASTC